jgi:hypothetical protein
MQVRGLFAEADDAQQSVEVSACRGSECAEALVVANHILNMADIGPTQGLVSWTCGLLTFSFFTDCRRMGFVAVETPLGGIISNIALLKMRKAAAIDVAATLTKRFVTRNVMQLVQALRLRSRRRGTGYWLLL